MIGSVWRRAWPSLALAAVFLCTVTFVVRACYFRNDICFLAERSPAPWIIYPLPAFGGTRPGVPLDAIFRRSFSLASVPAEAKLGVRAFRTCTIQLNGKVVLTEFDSDHWKVESRLDVRRFLRTGSNDLAVTVTNASGPPALWLALSCPETVLVSDRSWEVSLAGATWLPAALAADPVPIDSMDEDGMAEQVVPSVGKVWPMWLIFGGISAATVWLCSRWLAGGRPWEPSQQKSPSGQQTAGAVRTSAKKRLKSARQRPTPSPPRKEDALDRSVGWWKTMLHPPGPHGRWIGLTRLLFGLIAVFWLALFLHNSRYLAPDLGFDAQGHLAYIKHFQTSWSVPLPGQGWQTHHPPLYHFLVARLLNVVGCAPDTPQGILTIRLFNLVLALTNIYIILACLRLVFPEHPCRWVLGLLVAAFLPMHLYLYQYPTNHILGCTLASLAIYFVLRILCVSRAGMRDYVCLGLSLGFALLSIVSISPLVVVVGAVLLAKSYISRAEIHWQPAAFRMFVPAAVVFAVCGWYYAWVWGNLGTPIVANTGSGAGSPWPWWQDPGFRTGGDCLRFGQSLRSPLWSAWYSVWDGLYCTLWGDSYCGGGLGLDDRPPWSFDYLVAGMLLALVPSAAILLGSGAAVFHFLRKPTIVWAFLLSVAFMATAVVLYGSLRVPYYFVKAFYGLAAAVPLCALAALGFDLFSASRRWLRAGGFIVLGMWAFNSAASYVISPGTAETQRYVAKHLASQHHVNEAIAKLEQMLVAHPDDDLTRMLLANTYLHGKLNGPAQRVLELPAGQCERSSRHYLLGVLLAKEKRMKDARRELQTALKLAPDNMAATVAYAQVVSTGPELRKAVDAWRNVLRVNPTDAKAHAALAQLYLKTDDPSLAERHEKYFRALVDWNRQKNAQRF
jgi:cytochrome c-type biogenesis protein CcmH/NrfG